MMEMKPEPKEFLKRIVRAIPVGFGGYIIGKKGSFKSQINTEFGAELRLFNDPLNPQQQIIFIDCPEDQLSLVEQKIDDKISEINKKIVSNTINTITSNPDQLKPRVQLGKLIPGFVMNMSHTNDIVVILDSPQSNAKYEEMHESINLAYTQSPPRIPFPIGAGCICIALGSRAKFYRGLVLSYYCDLAHVYFVDIGKIELLPYNRLFKIKVKHLELPFRAIPCRWNNSQLNSTIANIDEVIYRRFLCNRETSRPQRVYFYFTHVDCCIPSVNIYVAKPGDSGNKDEFVDLLELLTTVGLAQTVPSEIVLSHNCRRLMANSNTGNVSNSNQSDALFYKPCNFSYYESLTSISAQRSDAHGKSQ